MGKAEPLPLKLTNQQVGNAGQQFVAAEIHRRGGYAVTFAGNMKGIDLLASDAQVDRVVKIQVKTKTRGTWQTTTREGHPQQKRRNETRFWVLVDLGPAMPEFYVMPAWWIENDIHTAHEQYLAKHGGHRARSDESTHHSIPVHRIQNWKDRWDVLRIFST
jgi:hypothetical protein